MTHFSIAEYETKIECLESEKKFCEAFNYVEQMIEAMKNDPKTSKDIFQRKILAQLQNTSIYSNELLKIGNTRGHLKYCKKQKKLRN